MNKEVNISEAEWEVMKIIWERQEVTSKEIIESLSDKKEWKAATIKSLISRLLNKEAITFEKVGKEYIYSANIKEDFAVREESKSFLNRVFNGSISDLLLNFVKEEKLSKEDIEELRDILNNSKGDI